MLWFMIFITTYCRLLERHLESRFLLVKCLLTILLFTTCCIIQASTAHIHVTFLALAYWWLFIVHRICFPWHLRVFLFFLSDCNWITLHELCEYLVAWNSALSLIHDCWCTTHVAKHARRYSFVQTIDGLVLLLLNDLLLFFMRRLLCLLLFDWAWILDWWVYS